jgi:competence protein ComEC
VIDNGQGHPSLLYKMFKSQIEQKNISRRTVQMGQEISFDKDLKIDVLSPPLPHYSGELNRTAPSVLKIPAESVAVKIISGDLNQNSLVLRVTYGVVSLLLMGDADTVTEGSLVLSGCNISSDILKVGHHGGSSASSTPFLRSVMPDISIIEVGRDNYYGYPTQKTLTALRDAGSEIYRTDTNGNITITTDGLNYSVSTEKDI